MSPETILKFWYEDITPKQWWEKDAEFDALLKEKFGEVHALAAKGGLAHWRSTPRGRLAEIIVLDQFSRNIFRDKPESFAQDALALELAQEAVEMGLDEELGVSELMFFYMPYMHSESLSVHEQAVKLYSRPGLEDNLDFEHKHKVIIERFGRYPHRNAILGRESTPEEIAFLKEPNSSF